MVGVEDEQQRKLSMSHKNIISVSPAAVERELMTPASYALSYSLKGHPVCVEDTLIEEAMSPEELSELCFSKKRHLEANHTSSLHPPIAKWVHTSDGSNTASCSGSSSLVSCTSFSSVVKSESVNLNYVSEFSDAESCVGHKLSSDSLPQHHHLIKIHFNSDDLQAKIQSKSTSKQGRKGQRWRTDAFPPYHTNRLVTGCIPIVKGGKIILVSATKKKEWIFPKGGWEQDETIEECAMRESFEEAGVWGCLGPRLTEIQYETRKARKRRLEFEEVQARYSRSNKKEKVVSDNTKLHKIAGKIDFPTDQKKEELIVNHITSILSSAKTISPHQAYPDVANISTKDKKIIGIQTEVCSSRNELLLRDKELEGIRERHRKIENKQCDEELSSNASWDTTSSGSYSHIRMTLFPLYVSEVKSQWPESGRCRKAVPIDEAIKMLDTRPELQRALKEVKEKRLHLVLPETETDC